MIAHRRVLYSVESCSVLALVFSRLDMWNDQLLLYESEPALSLKKHTIGHILRRSSSIDDGLK